MKITNKFIKNIEKIMKIEGFIITAKGDPSVGINETSWKLEPDFYFDNQEELEMFRTELKNLFEFYCGDLGIVVKTFEEQQKLVDMKNLN